MANTNKSVKNNNNNKKVKKHYSNPMSTVWAKILVIILCVAMVAGIVASLIYLLVEMAGNV